MSADAGGVILILIGVLIAVLVQILILRSGVEPLRVELAKISAALEDRNDIELAGDADETVGSDA